MVKNLPANRSPSFDAWVGKIFGKGYSNPLLYSCVENPTDRGAWQATVHSVAKSWTQLTNYFHFAIIEIVWYGSKTYKKANRTECSRNRQIYEYLI